MIKNLWLSETEILQININKFCHDEFTIKNTEKLEKYMERAINVTKLRKNNWKGLKI